MQILRVDPLDVRVVMQSERAALLARRDQELTDACVPLSRRTRAIIV